MGEQIMASKEDFLNRIAERLGRPRVYEVNKPKWHRHPWDAHLLPNLGKKELAQLFEQELQKLGAEVIRIPTLAELGKGIQSWLEQHKVKQIISWDVNTPVGKILKEALQEAETSSQQTASPVHVTFWNETGDKEELINACEQADVGFTIAEYGLAETGSIVLYNRGNSGRLVSLLPSISVNILLSEDIVPRITPILAELANQVETYSCINFITGPSRSADIEMDLSIGVHGPGHFVVLLVEEEHNE